MQKVNLYNLLPKKVKEPISTRFIAICYGLFFVLLLIQLGSALWDRHKVAVALDQENKLFTEDQARLSQLIAKYPNADPTNIKNMGASLRAELTTEIKILKVLAQSAKFSLYLQGLAQSISPNAWITNINFASIEPYIQLKGNALTPPAAQQFLDRLNNEPIFKGLNFGIDDLSQTTVENGNYFSFNITTDTGLQHE